MVYIQTSSKKVSRKKNINEKISKEEKTKHKIKEHELDEKGKKVLKILKENEGRMIQKELRNIFNFSETKMSLVITKLESLGLVKRIKKGRENILKLIEKI